MDHIVAVAGIDHVGYGADFDGIEVVPVGLENPSKFPALTAELLRRGYDEVQVSKVWWALFCTNATLFCMNADP